MYKYQDLGLTNIDEMMAKAYREGYAIPAFNFISIEQYSGIIDAISELKSPVMLLVSPNLLRQLGGTIIGRISQSGVDRMKEMGLNPEISLHLDHGMKYEDCVEAINYGFSSVMIDGSALSFEDNIALTKKVVDYAHSRGVSVEGELGVLSGAEEEGEHANDSSKYTDPKKVEEFVRRTDVDCLAISIGTSHGLVKMKADKNGNLPELKYEILKEIEKNVPNFPIVLHGSSALIPKYMKMINDYGGNIPNSVGIPEEQVAKVAKMAVCKVNIASDGWVTALGLTRKILAENPASIDSRVFTLKVRPALKEVYINKIKLLGSENKLK